MVRRFARDIQCRRDVLRLVSTRPAFREERVDLPRGGAGSEQALNRRLLVAPAHELLAEASLLQEVGELAHGGLRNSLVCRHVVARSLSTHPKLMV